ERSGGSWALGAAARCDGLLARGDFDAHFERALTHHARVRMPFETARTMLVYGERLHRERRRAEARRHLRSAQEIFEALGAKPWADRAEAELRAAGAVRRRANGRPVDALSDQEVRVATAVGRGATNRQAAAELFLSPKT